MGMDFEVDVCYFDDTDTIGVVLGPEEVGYGMVHHTEEAEGMSLLVDYDDKDRPLSFDIRYASQRVAFPLHIRAERCADRRVRVWLRDAAGPSAPPPPAARPTELPGVRLGRDDATGLWAFIEFESVGTLH